MRRILFMFLLALVLSTPARADRWYVATAYDTETPLNESGYSNEVEVVGPITLAITFAWDLNTEPDIGGYHLHVSSVMGGPYSLIDIDIPHLDACTAAGLALLECKKTLSLEPITQIVLQEDLP